MVAVVTDVCALQEERNPTDLIFREKDAEVWKAIENSRQNPLHRSNGTVTARRTESAHLVDKILGEFFHDFFGFTWVFEEGPFAFAGAFKVDVHADRHF